MLTSTPQLNSSSGRLLEAIINSIFCPASANGKLVTVASRLSFSRTMPSHTPSLGHGPALTQSKLYVSLTHGTVSPPVDDSGSYSILAMDGSPAAASSVVPVANAMALAQSSAMVKGNRCLSIRRPS